MPLTHPFRLGNRSRARAANTLLSWLIAVKLSVTVGSWLLSPRRILRHQEIRTAERRRRRSYPPE